MGELIVDMIALETGKLTETSGFLKNFGGAPGNTAIGLAKLGIKVGYVGKVGNDSFGEFLINTLQRNGVDTTGVIKDNYKRTTLAFVSLTETGERDFTFYRGAHEQISPENVREDIINQAKVFHFGSLLQINQPSKEATEECLKIAEKNGMFISYDPNYRDSLWGDKNLAVEAILSTIPRVSLLKINEEEMEFLTGTKNPKRAVELLPVKNQLVVVTLGEKGCYYHYNGISNYVNGFKMDVVDTTGAGDAFNAGGLYGLLPLIEDDTVGGITEEQLNSVFRRANLIAAITTTKRGGITAFPELSQLKEHENYL